MAEDRQGFNFLKSYYDIYKKIKDKESRDQFIIAICEKQLNGVDPNFEDMEYVAELAYIGQKHNIDKSRKGWEDIQKRNPQSSPRQYPSGGPSGGPSGSPSGSPSGKEQEQEQVKEKVKEKVQGELLKKSKPTAFKFLSELKNLGIDEDLVSDFMEVRKKRKAVNTKTAFNKLKNQLDLALSEGRTFDECIELAVDRSWQTYKWEWHIKTLNEEGRVRQKDQDEFEKEEQMLREMDRQRGIG